MRKAFTLCRLYSGTQTDKSVLEKILAVAALIMYPMFTITCNIYYNYPFWVGCMICIVLSDSIRAIREPKIRVLPVKDSYLLKSILFLWPVLATGFLVFLAAGLLLYNALIRKSMDGWLWYSIWTAFTSPWFWIGFLFLIGFWFASASGQLSMDGRKRIVGRIIDMVLLGSAVYIYSRLNPKSCYYIYDAVDSTAAESGQILKYPGMTWLALVLVCLWVLITAIAAYRKGMYFLRHDVKSQKNHDLGAEALWANTQRALYEGSGKIGKITTISVVAGLISGILIVALVIYGIGFDFGQGTEIDQICTDASQYDEWGNLPEMEEYEDSIFDGSVYQIIFPDEIDESQVETYYSNVKGKFGDGWSSIDISVRYLKISYSEEEFAAEKQRISDLKVTADHEDEKGESFYGTSQGMILDTQHFPYETYIAVWNPSLPEFEYAMFDDAEDIVYYVYAWDTELDRITSDDTLFEGNAVLVISEEEQNAGEGNYNIYAFGYRNSGYTPVEP